MTKRIVSLLMSLVIAIGCLSAVSFSAQADTFENEMKSRGFSDSYIKYLSALHTKYPNWDFKPFKTGLTWADAVKGERNKHHQQLIEKPAPNMGYYCECSSCYVNGSYVVREGKSWVAASESAVKYYMDPRNWLDDKNIFMFESNLYKSDQTVEGIESIIAGTWMHNAYITYKDSKGNEVTYKNSKGNKVKYSTAILDAAKNSGASAYYLASKIVQEVGSSKNTASGTTGTVKGYEGIYNYYSIGANTGAIDGLKWASVSGESTNCTAYIREKATTSSSSVVKVPSGTQLTIVSTTAKQSDGYVWYKVDLEYSGKSYSGYIRSDLVSKSASYGRPWTNPYLSIYNGATWIANGYSKYQYTPYLQKFNVNKESGSLYNHEYAANVQCAKKEAVRSYDAYNQNNMLQAKKEFYIPVFNSMPSNPCPEPTSKYSVQDLKLTARKTTSLSYSWTAYKDATKYEASIKNLTKGTSFTVKDIKTNSVVIDDLTAGNEYSVKVRAYTTSWQDYSYSLTDKTLPEKVIDLKVTSTSATTVKLSWKKVTNCDGYIIYSLVGDTYKKVKAVAGSSTVTASLTGLYSGKKYTLKVAAYVDNEKNGTKSSLVYGITKPAKVTGVKLTPSKTTIKVKWSKATGSATGYQVSFAKDKAFNSVIATKTVKGQSTLTYTGKNFTKGKTYYVRVRTYKTISGKNYYGTWCTVYKTTCK